jgi:hypothetical protein
VINARTRQSSGELFHFDTAAEKTENFQVSELLMSRCTSL